MRTLCFSRHPSQRGYFIRLKNRTASDEEPHCIRRVRELHDFFFVGRKFLKTRKKTALLLDWKPHCIRRASGLHSFSFSSCYCVFHFSLRMNQTACDEHRHYIRWKTVLQYQHRNCTRFFSSLLRAKLNPMTFLSSFLLLFGLMWTTWTKLVNHMNYI